MIDLTNCKCLNDIARQEFGLANYTNREKCKKILLEEGIDWKEWLENRKNIKPKKYCLHCGKEIVDGKHRKKFCNQSCSASYNNHKRGNKPLINLFCLNCGKELHKKQHGTKYCSQHCQQEYQYKQYIERWKKGEENGMCGEYGLSNHIRHYLLEKTGYKCEKCGWGEENPHTHTIPLEIHHIDGNYTNNKEENLQVLCPNCHSLTETYKSHNKSGRKERKKYNL